MTGTYVGLKPTTESAQKLDDFIKKIGLKNAIPKNKFHLTLYYARKTIEGFTPKPDEIHEAYVIGYEFLGKGEWAAIVLKLFSPSIYNRHQEIKTSGISHSYPEFIPHISLKYKPSPEDIQLVASDMPIGMTLELTDEYFESLKGD